MTDAPVEWELKAQVPPGFLELVAHERDDDLLVALDEHLGEHREQLGDADLQAVRGQVLAARRLAVSSGMRLGGVVLTAWEDAPTTWVYGIWVVPVETSVGLNPVGLVERAVAAALDGRASSLASLLVEGTIEDFSLAGGRVGTSLYGAVDGSRVPTPTGAPAGVVVPERPGLVLAAVPMPGLPQAAGLVIGLAPTVEQRGAMALFASAMAHSVHLLPVGSPGEAELLPLGLDEAFGVDADARSRS